MRTLYLGKDAVTGEHFRIPRDAFRTHFHLIGGTGKGKTTAIFTILQQLLLDDFDPACFIIVDRLGGFSQELLMWMASTDFCTDAVRDRLIYIQPSREDLVMPFNPLLYDTPVQAYYQIERTTEIILRAWESVDIASMPRLARWTYNAFAASAQLGLTVSDSVHFLMPGSEYHERLLKILPPRLQAEWQEIMLARSTEAIRILESTRNRLKPYFESDILRRMFGSTTSRLNVRRFMAEAKIVILDLSPRNRLSTQLADTIGALVINEVLATARSLPRNVRYPTYLFLDEFQNFVGPDIESALPEVRQLGLRLVLSHQSLSQLKRGDHDLSSMIFQAQSRIIFGVQGEDADILAGEVASITFDSRRVKDELYTRRQLQKGHRLVALKSGSVASSSGDNWTKSSGESRSYGKGETSLHGAKLTDSKTDKRDNSASKSEGRSSSSSSSSGWSETLVPEYEEFLELSSKNYVSFDEQRSEWAKRIRNLRTGNALIRMVDDASMREIRVKRFAPGHLSFDIEMLAREFPEAIHDFEELLERNFESEFFVPAHEIDTEIEERIRRVANPTIFMRTAPETIIIAEDDGKPATTERAPPAPARDPFN